MVNYKNKYLKYKLKYLKLIGGVKVICDKIKKKEKCKQQQEKGKCKWTPFPLPGKCWYNDEKKVLERYHNILDKYGIYE